MTLSTSYLFFGIELKIQKDHDSCINLTENIKTYELMFHRCPKLKIIFSN